MIRFACLVLLTLISACTGPAPPPAGDATRLVDCTSSFFSTLDALNEKHPDRVPSALRPAHFSSQRHRTAVVNAATEWSRSHNYLPCSEYQMCVALTEGPRDSIRALIRPQFYIRGWIAPSADLTISRDSLDVQKSVRHHAGCARHDELAHAW